MNANATILAGRLTRDPELRRGSTGKPYCRFSIAVDRQRSQDGEADFFDCTAFGKQAERLGSLGRRGGLVLVAGRLQQDRWEKDGQKRSRVVVIADSVKLAELEGDVHRSIGNVDEASPFPAVPDGTRPMSEVSADEMPF